MDVRKLQAAELASALSTSPYDVIIAGDINSERDFTADSYQILVGAGYTDAWLETMPARGLHGVLGDDLVGPQASWTTPSTTCSGPRTVLWMASTARRASRSWTIRRLRAGGCPITRAWWCRSGFVPDREAKEHANARARGRFQRQRRSSHAPHQKDFDRRRLHRRARRGLSGSSAGGERREAKVSAGAPPSSARPGPTS